MSFAQMASIGIRLDDDTIIRMGVERRRGEWKGFVYVFGFLMLFYWVGFKWPGLFLLR